MKKLLLIISICQLVCPGPRLLAQDAIVRINGDSIYCKVLEQNSNFIYYLTPTTRRGKQEVISRMEVREVLIGIRQGFEYSFQKTGTDLYDKLMIGSTAGYSRLLVDLEPFEGPTREYYNKLYSGYYYELSLGYMASDKFGVAAIAARSKYFNEGFAAISNTTYSGVIRDDITLDYFGLQACLLFANNNYESGFEVYVGVGVNRFKNNYTLIHPFPYRGTAVGANLAVGYRLMLAPGVFIPMRLTVRGFQLIEVDVQSTDPSAPPALRDAIIRNVEQSAPYNITRVEVGIGLLLTF